MHSLRPRLGRSALLAAGVALLAAVAACGGGSSGGTTSSSAAGSGSASSMPSISKDAALAKMLPSSIASKGTLTIGTDASYAPSEFVDTDGKTVIGFDVDLAKALGQVLGVQVNVQNAPFGTIIEGVKSGKFDLGMSSFTIRPDRIKQVDMVSYYSAGTAWAVAAGNPEGVTPDNACGKKVAVQKDTVQVDDITARSKKCTDAGKPAIAVEQFPLQTDVTSAVVTGKDDAELADSPVIANAIKQTNGKLQQVGEVYASAPYGIVVPKNSGDYAKAIQGAVQKLIDSGAYETILKNWGVEGGAIKTSEINPTS
ncbi:MAG TPA: ABC transporter substrate-binding protein [Kineosporiaceae bacterium]|nr:ABC transporter substrate-binding protein [Kineosporiaceae bacterium]